MSTASDNNKDQINNEALFLWYAGKDLSKWNVIVGTHVISIEDGKGEIVQINKSKTYGVFFAVRFENAPENVQDYAPLALEKGAIVFSKLCRRFEETKALILEEFMEVQEKLEEEARQKEIREKEKLMLAQERREEEMRQKEIKEKEKSALLHYKNLCMQYQVPVSYVDTPVELLFVILLKLEGKEALTQEELTYLEKRKAFFALAQYYELLSQQTIPDPWDYIKAASYYRKAGDPKRALDITGGVGSTDSKINSAILVTRGGAFRDQKDLKRAESCANEALILNPNSFHAYNLLGAIAYQSGAPEEGEEYFDKAIELGSKPQAIDATIREALERAGQEEKIKTARYLLNKDAKRYSWASNYLKDVNK